MTISQAAVQHGVRPCGRSSPHGSSLPSGSRALLRHLTEATGRRWTSQNDRDMALLGELLLVEAVEEGDTIPPYQQPVYSDRTTVNLERPDYGDPEFARWRARR